MEKEIVNQVQEVQSPIQNKYKETNKIITEIKNTLEGINSRIYEAEE